MSVRVDADDGCSNRADKEMAAVMEDVHPVLPEVLLPNKRRREAEAELLSSVVGKSVVWVYVVVDERGGLKDDNVVARSMLY